MSLVATQPTTSSMSMGEMPVPGPFVVSMARVMAVPFGMGLADTMDLLSFSKHLWGDDRKSELFCVHEQERRRVDIGRSELYVLVHGKIRVRERTACGFVEEMSGCATVS